MPTQTPPSTAAPSWTSQLPWFARSQIQSVMNRPPAAQPQPVRAIPQRVAPRATPPQLSYNGRMQDAALGPYPGNPEYIPEGSPETSWGPAPTPQNPWANVRMPGGNPNARAIPPRVWQRIFGPRGNGVKPTAAGSAGVSGYGSGNAGLNAGANASAQAYGPMQAATPQQAAAPGRFNPDAAPAGYTQAEWDAMSRTSPVEVFGDPVSLANLSLAGQTGTGNLGITPGTGSTTVRDAASRLATSPWGSDFASAGGMTGPSPGDEPTHIYYDQETGVARHARNSRQVAAAMPAIRRYSTTREAMYGGRRR